MLTKKNYANGQKAHELVGTRLTYFFKNGKVKAEWCFVDDEMEGEWKFYREPARLWQVGNFTKGKKNGSWVRYDRNGQLEYQEAFKNDNLIK